MFHNCVSKARKIFSDEKKRPLYDEYGSFGLYIAEQVGEEFVGSVMFFQSGWFKVSAQQLVSYGLQQARLLHQVCSFI